jgi:hypothetical protein
MELHQLKQEFDKVITKYNLAEPAKAEKISKFLTSNKKIDSKEFSKTFEMEPTDAEIFIKFIMKGIQYKEKNIDPHNKTN